jgi:hypothetical protein
MLRLLYSREKIPRYPLIRRVDFGAGLDAVAKRKKIFVSAGNVKPVIPPIAQLIY